MPHLRLITMVVRASSQLCNSKSSSTILTSKVCVDDVAYLCLQSRSSIGALITVALV